MALQGQIDAAARPSTPSPVVGSALTDDALLAMPARDPATEKAERVAAERMVRRLGNRHGCEGTCDLPEHSSDAAAMTLVLAILGLAGTDTLTAYTVGPESNAPVVVKQAKAGRCTGCGETKPADGFYAGRSKCKACHQKVNSANQSRRNRVKAPSEAKRTGRRMKPRVRAAEKRCSQCHQSKTASEFYAEARNPDGLRSECRECFNAKRRARGVEVAA